MNALEEKVIEAGKVLCDARKGMVYKAILEMVERPLIEYALQRTEGNQFMAARILGMNRNTIRSKMKKLGIDAGKWKMA